MKTSCANAVQMFVPAYHQPASSNHSVKHLPFASLAFRPRTLHQLPPVVLEVAPLVSRRCAHRVFSRCFHATKIPHALQNFMQMLFRRRLSDRIQQQSVSISVVGALQSRRKRSRINRPALPCHLAYSQRDCDSSFHRLYLRSRQQQQWGRVALPEI